MQDIILVIHILLAMVLVALVLLQRSEGGALGIGGGGGGFVTSRGAANFLTRMTAIVAGLFMLTSITLTIIAARSSAQKSVVDTVTEESAPALPPLTSAPLSQPESRPESPQVPTPN